MIFSLYIVSSLGLVVTSEHLRANVSELVPVTPPVASSATYRVSLACALLYAIPRTSVLGAILVTGYFGGAVATELRVGGVFVGPLMLGIFAWAGLYLRDARVRALIPLRAT